MNSDLFIEIIEKLTHSIDSKLDWDNPQIIPFIAFVYAIFQEKAYDLSKIQELINRRLPFLSNEEKKIILNTVQFVILEKLKYLKKEFDIEDDEDYEEEEEGNNDEQVMMNQERTFEERSKRYLEFMQDFFKNKESALLQKKDKIAPRQNLTEDLNFGEEIDATPESSLQQRQQFLDSETVVNLQKQESRSFVDNNEDLLVIAKDDDTKKSLENADILNLNKDKQVIINQSFNQQGDVVLKDNNLQQTASSKPKKSILVFWKSGERKETSRKDTAFNNVSESPLTPTIILKKKSQDSSSKNNDKDSMLDLSNL